MPRIGCGAGVHTRRRAHTIPALEWHGPGGPAGLQNRPGVVTPRLLSSTLGPLRPLAIRMRPVGASGSLSVPDRAK
jgi:hypothetical protein